MESKNTLRAYRGHALAAWLSLRGTTIAEYVMWSTRLTAAEAVEWARIDARYEAAKVVLKTDLYGLAPREWRQFCEDESWVRVGATQAAQVDDYFVRQGHV